MVSKRILDKATKNYYKIKSRFEMPGWVLSFIGVSILIAGILVKIKSVIGLGILFLSLGVGAIIIGKGAHLTFLKK